ncbi:MAG: DUF4388 domain-containing protein [Myxococcales bacterium]|nr:DUF4388 domain-containing protein [Myxococcales bacterium]
MKSKTLPEIFELLAEKRHTGTLRLERAGRPDLAVHIADGRVVALATVDGTLKRRDLPRLLVEALGLRPRRLARLRRKAAARGVTLEWALRDEGVPEARIRALATVDAREQLLELMGQGGYTAHPHVMTPMGDPWLEALPVAFLCREFRERQGDQHRWGSRLPDPDVILTRTGHIPDGMFRRRGAIENTSSPYAARTGVVQTVAPSLPQEARVAFMFVDGHRTAEEIGFATGLGTHDARVAMVQLQHAGLVAPALNVPERVSRSSIAMSIVTATFLVLASSAAWLNLVLHRLEAAREVDVVHPMQACGAAMDVLAADYVAARRYPASFGGTRGGLALSPAGVATVGPYDLLDGGQDYVLEGCGRAPAERGADDSAAEVPTTEESADLAPAPQR